MNKQQVQIKRDDLIAIIAYALEQATTSCIPIIESTADEDEQQAILEQLLQGVEQLDADTLIIAAK